MREPSNSMHPLSIRSMLQTPQIQCIRISKMRKWGPSLGLTITGERKVPLHIWVLTCSILTFSWPLSMYSCCREEKTHWVWTYRGMRTEAVAPVSGTIARQWNDVSDIWTKFIFPSDSQSICKRAHGYFDDIYCLTIQPCFHFCICYINLNDPRETIDPLPTLPRTTPQAGSANTGH